MAYRYTTRFEHNGKSYEIVIDPSKRDQSFFAYVQVWPILKNGNRRRYPLVSHDHVWPVWTAFQAAGLVK